jgi:hypothetical protein
MSTPAFAVPPALDRIRGTALLVGVAGMLLSLVGGALDPTQFFRSYLFAFLFWTGIGLGATGLTFFDDDVTTFFSPHAAGKGVMFLVAVGRRPVPRSGN